MSGFHSSFLPLFLPFFCTEKLPPESNLDIFAELSSFSFSLELPLEKYEALDHLAAIPIPSATYYWHGGKNTKIALFFQHKCFT